MRALAALVAPLCMWRGARAATISVDDSSLQWTYTPPVCPSFCDGSQTMVQQSWWQLAHQRQASAMQGFYNLTETATNLRGASASLVFNGTAISYFGNFVSNGAHILFDLDGRKFNVSSISPTDPERRQSLLWDLADLSPSVEHRLTVTMMSGTFMDVDRVDITVPDAPATTQPSPSASPRRRPSASTAAIAGGLAGGAVLLLIAALVVLYHRRSWRRSGTLGTISSHSEVGVSPVPPFPTISPYSIQPALTAQWTVREEKLALPTQDRVVRAETLPVADSSTAHPPPLHALRS